MRFASIDILRTTAIAVMVIVHFGENLSGYIPPIAGLGAPLFAFLSGMSYYLWARGLAAKQICNTDISKISIRRALFVFGLGFAFNIFVWLPEDTFNWDVLTFVGSALLLLTLLRLLPLSISVVAAVMVLLASPALRVMADYPAYWENNYFDCDLTLSDVLIGFVSTGYFPIFPWITYSIAGFVVGALAYPAAEEPPRSLRPILLFGFGLAALAGLGILVRPLASPALTKYLLEGWTMYPPTTTYVLGTLGMAISVFTLLTWLVDRGPPSPKYDGLLEVAKTFSRYSLTIYLVHHFVHIWPLWIYALATGNEPTLFWKKAMPATVSLPLAILFLAVCYFLFRRLGSERTHGVESLMRWLCD